MDVNGLLVSDTMPVERVETAALALARAVGVNAAQGQREPPVPDAGTSGPRAAAGRRAGRGRASP